MPQTIRRLLAIDTPVIFMLMLVSLAIFQHGSRAYDPPSLSTALLGIATFGILALIRPVLAVYTVPLAVPLYLIPAQLPGLRPTPVLIPAYEAALWVAVVVFLAHSWHPLLLYMRQTVRREHLRQTIREWAPQLLFVIAGILGVLLAVERGAALREFRWLILEPLLFYALLRWYDAMPGEGGQCSRTTAKALVIAGCVTASIGLLQFVGIDLAGIFGTKVNAAFTDNTVSDGGVLRVTSVYGHPNNLGLALERAWPLAAMLAYGYWRGLPKQGRNALGWSLATLLCLAGLVVSFSRGALLGSAAALLVLLAGLWLLSTWRQTATSPLRISTRWIGGLVLVGATVIVLAVLALTLRGGPLGGSTEPRMLLWKEALQLIIRHPLGLGLDQFYYYHNPEFGRSIIDPSLIGTSEEFAAHPHNLILDLWLRLGPLGLIAFGWLLVRLVRGGLARIRTASLHPAALAVGTLAAITAALTHGMLDVFYFVPDLAFAFWLLLRLTEPPHEHLH